MFNLFGLIPFDPGQSAPLLHLGVWPLIMGVTMFLQQKLNPPPPDPVQAKMFQFMPILFTFMLAGFPAGLVIYWTWNNTLSIGQQWLIMRRTRLSRAEPRPDVTPEALTEDGDSEAGRKLFAVRVPVLLRRAEAGAVAAAWPAPRSRSPAAPMSANPR